MGTPTPRRSQRRSIKLPDLYWSADSPLDGVARVVWTQCLFLARPQRDSHADSHAPPQRDRHALERDSHALERWPAAPLVDESLRSLTLADIARAVQLDRHLVTRAMQQLERLGEVARKPDGTWVVLRYGLTQERPDAERKRRQRARKKRDSHADSHADLPRDSHAAERDSHASFPARALLRSERSEDLTDLNTTTSPLNSDRVHAREPAVEAQRWLNEILTTAAATFAPPALGTKWERHYRWIGQRPQRELEQVGALLCDALRSRALRARYLTPQHLMSYWPQYAAGVLPNAPRLAAVAAVTPAELEQTALELEAEADNNPAWLQEAAP
jgi:hypothetical protein